MEASDTSQGGAPAEEQEQVAGAPEASEQSPAPEQSPVASAAQEAITGDHGMTQEPQAPGGGAQNTPHATSAPPPEAQPGIPLEADRAAGVQPGESSTLGTPATPEEGAEPASPEEAREADQANRLDPAAGTEAQEAENHVDPAQEGTVT